MIILPNLLANWPAPTPIKAISTKCGGFDFSVYGNNNLALHVNDDPERVILNRKKLKEHLALPNEPEWLEQTHSTLCVKVEEESSRQADASITQDKKRVLAILTADCLPILLCNQEGTEIAAIHAGWRGLVNGIIENTIQKMDSDPSKLLAWIGPAICQSCFEVGNEVYEQFQQQYTFASQAFNKNNLNKEKQFANLPLLAELVMKQYGISVFQSKSCTFEQKEDFYSYRRAAQTGRIASLIWFN